MEPLQHEQSEGKSSKQTQNLLYGSMWRLLEKISEVVQLNGRQ